MSLVVPGELSFFQECESKVINEFIHISYEFMRNNFHHKSYSNAAAKLGRDVGMIEKLVEKISCLFLDVVQQNILEPDFYTLCKEILPEDAKLHVLWNGITEKYDFLNGIISHYVENHLNFSSLHWRIQNVFASKCLTHTKDVTLTMSMKLQDRNNEHQHVFHIDSPNLLRITDILETALAETKSSHVKRELTVV